MNCERTDKVSRKWLLFKDVDGSWIEINMMRPKWTVGDMGITLPKAALNYGFYMFQLDIHMTGFPEFNDSTQIFALVQRMYIWI